MESNYLLDLNLQQRQAVLHPTGPQLVIAGAGSGKTRVLTYKIVHLLQSGYHPAELLALTFTNKAAREMKERIFTIIGDEQAKSLKVGTFHSIFALILRVHANELGYNSNYTILDQSDSIALIKRVITELGLDDKQYVPANVHKHISNIKNALISPADYLNNAELMHSAAEAHRPEIHKIYALYQQRCKIANAMDFDDILFNANLLLRDNAQIATRYQEQFRYILVDEYQDTNFAQHMLLLQLSRKHNNLFVVGDDAQSIYAFRGANVNNILTLEKAFPNLTTYKLEQNYRSTQQILDVANSLISKNHNQIAKQIYSEISHGAKVRVLECYTDREEANTVTNQILTLKYQTGDSFSDFAILYRTNALGRNLENALLNGGRQDSHGTRHRSIPYQTYGSTPFYQRKEVKNIVAYLKVVANPDDDESLLRIINYPTRGIGKTTTDKLKAQAYLRKVSIWRVLSKLDDYALKTNRGTSAKLQFFHEMITEFLTLYRNGYSLTELTKTIIQESGIAAELSTGKALLENKQQQQNLEEFLYTIKHLEEDILEAEGRNLELTELLSTISLATDQDSESQQPDSVTLMTIHAAKGLEYNNVIIVGVEQDIIPAQRSTDLASIEEERRLLYVAITRAKRNCILTYAKSRFINGEYVNHQPSQFITDIDPRLLDLPYSLRPKFSSQSTPFQSKPQVSIPRGKSALQSIPTTSQANSEAEAFTTHCSSELTIGTTLLHSKFGIGKISAIDLNGDSTKIIVEFQQVGSKTLMLKFAKFKLIK